MQIDPSDLDAGVGYRLLISVIVPRPIALISTVSLGGVNNAAPFSMFMGASSNPPMVAVSIASRKGAEKDTARNIRETGESVVNVVDEGLAAAMNLSSADLPPSESEFDYAGLTPIDSVKVHPPRIKEAPVSIECRFARSMTIGRSPNHLIIGDVLLFHVADELMDGATVDPRKLRPVGRLGESLYCRVRDIFEMKRPKLEGPGRAGK